MWTCRLRARCVTVRVVTDPCERCEMRHDVNDGDLCALCAREKRGERLPRCPGSDIAHAMLAAHVLAGPPGPMSRTWLRDHPELILHIARGGDRIPVRAA